MKKYLPLVNLGLRGLVLVSKFAFIFILANKLSVKELGEYGLFSSTVIYCLYFLGLDFYVYSNREVAKTDRVNAAKYINNQFFVYMVVATISILPLFLLSTMNIINRELFFYFCLILYLEHISQEMTRLLIVIGMPIIASITLFLRVALWTYVVTLFLYVFEDYSQLSFVLLLWLCGSLCSVIFATYIFRKNSLLNFSIGNIDYLWIIKGLKLAMPFLITTLIMRAVFVLDRYYLSWSNSEEVVGVYIVYVALCSAILYIVDALVFQYKYPKLIVAFHNDKYESFNRLMIDFVKSSSLVIFIVFIFIYLSYDFFIGIAAGDKYFKEIDALPLLLVAYVFYTVSLIPHYIMYAINDTKGMLMGNAAPSLIFIFVVVTLYFNGIVWDIYEFSIFLTVIFFIQFLMRSIRAGYKYRMLGSA